MRDALPDTYVILLPVDILDALELGKFLRGVKQWTRMNHRFVARADTLKGLQSLAAVAPVMVRIDVLTVIEADEDLIPDFRVCKMPAGCTATDADDLALALCDAIVVPSQASDAMTDLQKRAREYGKPELLQYDQPTWMPSARSAREIRKFENLDPRTHPCGFHWLWGRAESMVMSPVIVVPPAWAALRDIARAWRAGARHDGDIRREKRAASFQELRDECRKHLTAMLGRRRHDPELAEGWKDHCPDSRLRADDGKQAATMAWFDTFEQAAGNGARSYRDIIWLVHLFAAGAVFAAVAGTMWPSTHFWPWTELVLLLVILGMVARGRFGLHGQWMACRLGAEELRASILCVSLLVAPEFLRRNYLARPRDKASHHAVVAHSLAIRAVRDHGLCRLEPGFTAAKATRWVKLIAQDQLGYHKRNHLRLERLGHFIKYVNIALFVLVIAAVTDHLFDLVKIKWTLLVTAGGPALAGALHGAVAQLNVVQRSQSSRDCAEKLEQIIRGLDQSLGSTSSDKEAWPIIRQAALQTATAMNAEVESWHSILSHEALSLPA